MPADTRRELESDVEDLSTVSLRDLRTIDSEQWRQTTERLAREVQRPRQNFGGSGPPGRAD
jgi:hypothetical protein